jgi:oligoendopeptidase F
MTNIDSEFSNIFSNFLNNGAFDVFLYIGKTSGAFCVYFLKSQPVYILLNYNNTLQDVITLAHEVGHGINDELMRQQNALNFKTSIATAEVASTFMEDFVLEDILANADDNLRLSIMMMKLNSLVNSIFRQVALFKFEQEIHSIFRVKGYLSKEELGEIFYKNMTAYLGDSVSFSNHDKNNWVAWPHIRLYFYVYSYASGLLISKYLQKEFKKDHSFIIKIKDFLAAGSSVSPKELFNNLNIDISNIDFWQTGLDEIEILLNETEVLAKKLKKI